MMVIQSVIRTFEKAVSNNHGEKSVAFIGKNLSE